MRKLNNPMTLCGLLLLGLTLGAPAFSESRAAIDVNVGDALKSFYASNPKHEELVNKAAGLLVFPRITKGGAGIAGEYGKGVLMVGGKIVRYYSEGGASIGLTLGVNERTEVILFMTTDSLEKFRHSKGWTIGADAGVAVMSEGAGGVYDSKTLQKPIIGFVYNEKGLIADLSLEGSRIKKLPR